MRRIFAFALLGLTGLAAQAGAGCPLGGCCPDCKPIPCAPCCDCGCPCENRMNLNFFDRSEENIATLQASCGGDCACGGSTCCDRIKAAEKLGSRLHADFCCNPNVLTALVGALQCDKCWEVRKAAAWAIMTQGARTDEGVMALYISSKTDPHYMVRATAAEALDILTVCCSACYKDLYKRGDDLIKELKKKGYKPGSDNCRVVFGEACAACGMATAQSAAPAVQAAQPVVEAPVGGARRLPVGQ